MLTRTAVAIAAITSLTASMLVPPSPRFVWNATPSAPIGLYWVAPHTTPFVGAWVLVLPPPTLSRLFATRGYIPEHVPLLKRVAAWPGQRLCRVGRAVSVDGKVVAIALAHDRRGRPLPVWSGCWTLMPGELFVLSPGVRDALDGRYFGPLPRAALVGIATPLWTASVQ